MQEFTQNYAIHLDNIRIEYKMTQEALCDGITTTRNYRRYLTGERIIPHERIVEFCERLGISANDFFTSFAEKFKGEFSKVYSLYENIVNKEFKTFYEKVNSIHSDRFFDIQNKKFLYFCIEYANYLNKKTHIKDTMSRVSEIIDYPNCLNRNGFDFVDIISLVLITKIEIEFKQDTALNRLIEILTNPSLRYLSTDSRVILPAVYGNVSIALGRLNRFEDSLKIAEAGIDFSIKHNNMSALSHLRYAKAFLLMKTGYREQGEMETIRCLATALAKENQYEYDSLRKVLIKDFGEDPMSLISKYKDKFFSKE